ncbi:diacylglycerol kinase family protein [Zavarzinella formosa]|uniref:diacylglycerol kinase family protein n=1 Tax=Zavarzinella formosa TaxID=360055 RepID=UPI0002F7F4DF|nr:diacylglycerol kinase family protein [Zavarzinella formosa]
MNRRTSRLRSFRFAFAGLATLLKTQPNARIHAIITLAVVIAGIVFKLTSPEWCWIVLATAAVWVAEALNTSLEFLADAVCPEFHPLVKHSKDVAAGAVLLAAAGAVVIGLLIFGPHLLAIY